MSFDPTDFMNAAVTGANDTSIPPVPINEYQAFIEKLEGPKVFPITKGDRAGQDLVKLEAWIKIIAPGVENADGRLVKRDLILDIAADGKSLDMGKGKNIDLGQIREATGLNDPTQPFSMPMLVGRQLKVLIAHDIDKNDSTKVYSRISRMAKIS